MYISRLVKFTNIVSERVNNIEKLVKFGNGLVVNLEKKPIRGNVS